MDIPFRSIRHTLRKLLRSPGFTAITIVTLAIGIGANAAIFSVVHAVLIRPLPYPESERLVGVWHTARGLQINQFGHPQLTYWFYRQHNRVFEEVGIYASRAVNLTGGERPEELRSAEISPSLLPVLGVTPQLGRGFVAAEERPGAEPTVLLSHPLWQRRFGADPGVLGRTIQVDGVATTVIGVMPADFAFPTPETELWRPIVIDPGQLDSSYWRFTAIARLRPGMTPAAAEAEMSALVRRLPEAYPGDAQQDMATLIDKVGMAALVHPLHEDVVGEVSGFLRILLGSVGFLLLIACANVASLYLARAEGRQQELAVRTALGASRGAVAGAFLTESTILALAGGALGLAVASAALRLFLALAPDGIPRLGEIAIDGPVLAFTLAISLVSSLLFGAIPALRSLPRPALVLREGGRSATGGRQRLRARHLLVIAQLTLALVLMTGSGLMVRSFIELRNVDPGFDPAGILTLRLTPPEARYPGAAETVAFYQAVLERIRALPGVEAAGANSGLPLVDPGIMLGQTFEDFPHAAGEHVTNYPTQLIVPGFFETLGIPLVAGRTFERADLERPTGAVILSATLAERLWPGENAIGKRLTPYRYEDTGVWYTIVGVVGSVRYEGLGRNPTEAIYYPLAPLPMGADTEPLFHTSLNLAIRTSVSPASLTRGVSAAVWSVDPDVPIAQVRTMEEIVTRSSAPTAFTMLLLLIAAGVALVLGAVGLFGVISYLVSRRTHEIGIRMALGADRDRVSWMVLRQGLAVALVGLALGLAGAVAVTRVLESYLYEVSPTDPMTFGFVSLLLLAIALLASYLPARRAASVDPLEALRYE